MQIIDSKGSNHKLKFLYLFAVQIYYLLIKITHYKKGKFLELVSKSGILYVNPLFSYILLFTLKNY